LAKPLVAALAIIVIASSGFVVLTDLSAFESVYMTFISITTVGFSEVEPLDTTGRIWTMVVITAGYIVLISFTARFTAFLLSGSLTEYRTMRRRQKMQERLRDHVIIVGYGRVGRATTSAVLNGGLRCAVVESDPVRLEEAESSGAATVSGDARDFETLAAAGLANAISVVSTLDDADNLAVVATVKVARPDCRVVSRVNDLEWCGRLTRAGADELVPVFRSAGEHLANAATLNPAVGVVAQNSGLITEEIMTTKDSSFVGLNASEIMARNTGVVVLGMRNESGLARWHEIQGGIKIGDILVVVGEPNAIRTLR
jgi:voltage-gated potassium channel